MSEGLGTVCGLSAGMVPTNAYCVPPIPPPLTVPDFIYCTLRFSKGPAIEEQNRFLESLMVGKLGRPSVILKEERNLRKGQ